MPRSRTSATRRRDIDVTLRTEDGDLMYAHYQGLFLGAADVMSRLAAGEVVEPWEYYFRTAPFFETASAKYAWLNHTMAIGIGRRTRSQVAYSVYAIL